MRQWACRLLDALHGRRFKEARRGLSAYGKLPFDAEFLHLGVAEKVLPLIDWIDAAHREVVGSAQSTDPQRELRAALSTGAEGSLLAALIRASMDAKQRVYPICLFAGLDAQELQSSWELLPLWLQPVWESMRAALEAALAAPAGFDTLLENTRCIPGEIEVVRASFAEKTRRPLKRPWSALVGGHEHAAEWARSLAELACAQRKSGAREGLVVQFPLCAEDRLASHADAPTLTGIWIRLFSACSGATTPWPALIEVAERDTGRIRSVCLFGREPVASDLATLMTGVGRGSIDDVSDPWDGEEATEQVQELVGRLLADDARCLEDLWRM